MCLISEGPCTQVRMRKKTYFVPLSLQYVEKLEKILRFVIKEKALSLQDLDNIWAAQVSVERARSCNLGEF